MQLSKNGMSLIVTSFMNPSKTPSYPFLSLSLFELPFINLVFSP